MKRLKKKIKQMQRIIKRIDLFVQQTIKNYKSMKKAIIKILAIGTILFVVTSCNVTRRTTVESTYFQKGDTATTITVKTIETYDATKKGI